MQQFKIQAAIDKKSLGSRIERLRKLEISRANSALLNLSLEKTVEETDSISNMLEKSSLSTSQCEEAKRSCRLLLSQNLSNFKNKKRDPFAPPLSTVRSLSSLKIDALQDARSLKS
jgi:hypothetical protein